MVKQCLVKTNFIKIDYWNVNKTRVRLCKRTKPIGKGAIKTKAPCWFEYGYGNLQTRMTRYKGVFEWVERIDW